MTRTASRCASRSARRNPSLSYPPDGGGSMKTTSVLFLSAFALAAAQSASADDDHGFKRLGANLVGYEETPSSISTAGNGRFVALIRNDDTEIVYQLSYSDLEGAVLQAHIHFGQRRTSGGIAVFFCTNLGNGPAG